MRSLVLALSCVVSSLGLFSGEAWSSDGLNCRAPALRYSEAMVCNDPGITVLYREMKAAYELVRPAAIAIDPGVATRQAEWEHMLLTQCGNTQCLRAGLLARTSQLQQALVNVNAIRQARGEPPVQLGLRPDTDVQRTLASPRDGYAQTSSSEPAHASWRSNGNPKQYRDRSGGLEAELTQGASSSPQPPRQVDAAESNRQRQITPDAERTTPALAQQATTGRSDTANDTLSAKIAPVEERPTAIASAPTMPAGAHAVKIANATDSTPSQPPPAATYAWQKLGTATTGFLTAAQAEQPVVPQNKMNDAALTNTGQAQAKPNKTGYGIWEKTWIFLKASLAYLLILNTVAMIVVSCVSPYKLFTNHTDVLYVVGTAVIAFFSGALSGDLLGITITLACFGVVALHTFRTIPFPLLAAALLFAKFYLLVFAGMYILIIVLIAGVIGAFFAQRKPSTVNTAASMFTAGATGFFMTRLLVKMTRRLVLDPTTVSFEAYRLGITSSMKAHKAQRIWPRKNESTDR